MLLCTTSANGDHLNYHGAIVMLIKLQVEAVTASYMSSRRLSHLSIMAGSITFQGLHDAKCGHYFVYNFIYMSQFNVTTQHFRFYAPACPVCSFLVVFLLRTGAHHLCSDIYIISSFCTS